MVFYHYKWHFYQFSAFPLEPVRENGRFGVVDRLVWESGGACDYGLQMLTPRGVQPPRDLAQGLSFVRPPILDNPISDSDGAVLGVFNSVLTMAFCGAYGDLVFMYGGLDTMAHFELQPDETELQQLAEQYWQKAGEREKQLEKAAFEAGAAIRSGDYSLVNLEEIVRWKSERMVHYLVGNSEAKIKRVLAVAASPGTTVGDAVEALTSLRGVDLSIASAILAAVLPERYNVLDFRALEALGHARHNVDFYAEYVAFCRRLAELGIVQAQEGLPGPTPLHALDRALWEWSRTHVEQPTLV